jgi:Na+-transporting methylmalonyl-CoA/oxaloacetate decarboxylase gamma subunit
MNTLLLVQQPVSHKAAAEFAKLDPYGIGMTMVAMSVVFLSLVILYITFKNIAKLFTYDFKAKSQKKGEGIEIPNTKSQQTLELGTAIAMALHLYQNELHDHENALLTIKKVNGNYSPWSSKIYGMRKELK